MRVSLALAAATASTVVGARPITDPAYSEAVLRADCDAAASSRVLDAQAGPMPDARAYWLDGWLIQWPGAKAEGRFRLYHSATAALVAEPGKPVRGADGFLELKPVKVKLASATAARFKFVGEGLRLALKDDEDMLIRRWEALQNQMLLVREDAEGRLLDATATQLPGVLDDAYRTAASSTLLGASQTEKQTSRFEVWAPTAQSIYLCVYSNAVDAAISGRQMLMSAEDGVWHGSLNRDLTGHSYTYLVDVYVPNVGIVRNRVTDPYSVALTADSNRSVVLDLDNPSTKPDGWDAAQRPAAAASNTDMSVYELHVRDFSRDDASVRPAWRGKYLAFTERDAAGMRHLRALADAGMTDVHLLPVFDIATVPETGCATPELPAAAPDSEATQAAIVAVAAKDCFNWGYDPFHFNAPEGSYATDANDAAARIREFRAMVQALHAAGLRVGMDVVYNHASAAGQAQTSVLDRIVPGYYHRLNANGRVEMSTCCANTATEHRMMAKLMIDSAALWAKHYRIDSFRFDLMGHQPREAMERLQARVDAAAGRHVPLIGEGWNFGEIANGSRFMQASQLSLQNSGIATFSDRARDALRGGGCCDRGEGLVANVGWLNDARDPASEGDPKRRAERMRIADLARMGLAGTLRDVRMRGADGEDKTLSQFDYAGQPAGYAAEPGEVVNYVENHDNMTLFDLNALRLPRDTSREDRARVQLLGAATTAFSQGVAYYHAGIDILRSKSLDRNSFDSGDVFNRLDWSYRGNGFGVGLPPKAENGADWPWLKPVLADRTIAPTAKDIAWMRDAFRDLLRIRASSSLFRLRSAGDVRRRLSFRNVGPEQNPAVLVVHLNGAGIADGLEAAHEITAGEALAQASKAAPYPDAVFREILYFVNASAETQTLRLGEERNKPYVLHPVQRSPQATDPRPKHQARYDKRTGEFEIPARTAVVYVVE
ncbi:MAG: DUF3372 domain-containing protein [Xanthomonadaceae bacterium]|nr:DUF3372 domain-containing protein [Xanthomonadaceae bacterium]